ncbi:hypothetical protein [Deinococcus altitudinis]|uniref:hypothetical protein n=1 Tax=Deinococcus altitudinis TaxID=468914 RepID=UPI0038926A89
MSGLLLALLVLVNVGGFASLLFSLRQGQLLSGLTTLLLLGLLDMFGFWLLKSMRDDR